MNREKTALLIVDVQNDFLPGGALAIENGDVVVFPILEIAPTVDLVIASRDWHPENHSSFEAHGGIWPSHCVADTHGSALHPAIEKIADRVVDKGCDADKEAYSAFEGTSLHEQLQAEGITTLIVSGLATDYCVKASALDATQLGYNVILLERACRGVNADNDGCLAAIREMREQGIGISTEDHELV